MTLLLLGIKIATPVITIVNATVQHIVPRKPTPANAKIKNINIGDISKLASPALMPIWYSFDYFVKK